MHELSQVRLRHLGRLLDQSASSRDWVRRNGNRDIRASGYVCRHLTAAVS